MDARTGETHNFSNKNEVCYTEILLPEGAYQKFKNREYLCNLVELAEKRKDSQLAKDVILVLPRNLDLKEHLEITKNLTDYHFLSKGLVADIAIQ